MYTSDGYLIKPGMAVGLHPAHDLWMQGFKYGVVKTVGRKWVHVELQRLGYRTVAKIRPQNLLGVI